MVAASGVMGEVGVEVVEGMVELFAGEEGI